MAGNTLSCLCYAEEKRGMKRSGKWDLLLTITMLISNRPDTLEKCLNSLQPILSNLSSELILVDTAGNPAVLAIAKQYTNQIVSFPWCNDFAAARNAGLLYARGKWLMYLDDDEWFEDSSELVGFFQTGLYQQYQSAAYIARNYTDRTGRNYTDRVVCRLCKREANTKFIGRIHEQFYPIYEPAYYMKAYVHHYGYAFASEEEKLEHAWRNIHLLLEARKEEKDNWMAGAHLIQEYFAVKEYFALIEIAKEMRSQKESYENGRKDFTAYASVMEMRSYLKLKRYLEAYRVGKALLFEQRALLITHLCLAGMMPEICLKCSNEKEALYYCEMFWNICEKWKVEEQKNKERDGFSLRDIYFTEEQFGRVHMAELHVYVVEENWEQARVAFRAIVWKKLQSTMSNTFADVIQVFIHTEYERCDSEALEVLLKGKGSHTYLKEQIERLRGEERRKVLYGITQISLQDREMLQYRIEYALLLQDRYELELIFTIWKERQYSFFLCDGEYWRGLKELQINLSEWIGEIGILEWIQLTEALFEQMSENDCENMYQVLSRGLEKSEIRMLYLMGLRLEKHLLNQKLKLEQSSLGDLEMKNLWKELYQIASLWMSCAGKLYQEQVFQSELQSALPPKYRFAWFIFQANAVKGDIRNFVRKIAEAAKAYLKMEDICKSILRYCGTKEGYRANSI